MRTDKELIQVALDNLDILFLTGLCNFFLRLRNLGKVTLEERERLTFLLEDSTVKEEKRMPLTVDKRRIRRYNSGEYYWIVGEKQPRKQFLEYLLEVENAFEKLETTKH